MKQPPTILASANSPESRATTENAVDARLQRDGNNFNFLRLVFAAMVLLAHSFELIDGDRSREPIAVLFPNMTFGGLGVCGFFLISGFLIVRSWQQNPKLRPYFKKRILRIYPGFIVAFLVSVLIVGALGSALPNYFSALNYPQLLRQILTLHGPDLREVPVFQGLPYPVVNGSMWTISYEFACYVLVAVLGLLGVVRRPWLWLGLTLILCVLNPVTDRFTSVHFRGERIFSLLMIDKVQLLMLATYFFAGGCFFLFLNRIRFSKPLALLALALLVPAMFTPLALVALSILGGYLIFWFAFSPIPILDRFKRSSDVSYGLYLYGWPVQKLLLWYFPSITPYVLFPVALILSYLCGYLSWQIIEKPALQLKRRFNRDPRLVSA